MSGTLALVGGGEFTEGCTFDAGLLAVSGASEVLVLPTGAAYEHPHRSVEQAVSWFDRLGVAARGLDVLGRPDALDPANVEAVAASRFTYLVGGSPMHLRSVLKDSPVWEALAAAWRQGGVLAGSSAGAMVLCDPMVDPRGGAFTLGLVVGISVGDTTLGTTIANLGWDEVRFPRPLFHGDTVRVQSEVVEARASRSRSDAGIVTFAHRGYNQRDELVCTCKRAALMRKRTVAT